MDPWELGPEPFGYIFLMLERGVTHDNHRKPGIILSVNLPQSAGKPFIVDF